ncbi:MAG TPA: sugar ABC transporter permease, partial [Acidimicrobiales bacterium]|nr:sugar ABC transporter permease [Acidimicrobiales bacterium]
MARSAVVHTVVYVALTVPCEVGLGLIGAWLVTRIKRGRPVLLALLALPLAIPWTSASTMFLGFFNSGGVLDDLRAELLGAHRPVLWFQDPKLAFAVIVGAGIWKGTPWCFLLLVAALNSCPPDIFEAGRVDGARGLSYWSRVVVPAVRAMLVFVTVFRIFAEAQTYTSVALLTQGGPVNATQLASTYDNTLAFQYFQFGEASAL